jgi:hypothetical protein
MSLGCQRTPSESGAKPAAESSGAAPAAPSATTPAPHAPVVSPHAGMQRPGPGAPLGISWKDPDGWQRVTPSSSMRAAQYSVPAVAGEAESAEVTVFHFGSQMGGGVEENITRWVGQFKGVEPSAVKRSQSVSNGLTHYFVQIEAGQFQGSGMMGAPSEPKDNFGLLGVVTEAPTGKYFFKMTGPSKTVAANEAKFRELVESIQGR